MLQRLKRLLGIGAGRHGLVGPTELAEMKRAFQIRFLRGQGLVPDHYLLDLGCGTLRGGIPIIAYLEPAHYYGVEVRPEVLVEARKELAEHRLTEKRPVLLGGEGLRPALGGRQFDVVWAFSVIMHMSDEILRDILPLVADHLGPGATFYANVHQGERHDGRWQGFPVVTRPLAFYAEEARKAGLGVRSLGTLDALGHQSGRADHDAQLMLAFTRS